MSAEPGIPSSKLKNPKMRAGRIIGPDLPNFAELAADLL
jgi:hypothetical protein